VSPLERLKILLQIQSIGREEYRLSIWKALVKIGKEEGWRGFMRGNGTNCIRIIPYSAVQFGSYNFYKRVCCTSQSSPRIDFTIIIEHSSFTVPLCLSLPWSVSLSSSSVRRANSKCRIVANTPAALRRGCWSYLSHHHLPS
jgi:hypothetical protein